jgi:formate hydrogenlyase transcriptional activator
MADMSPKAGQGRAALDLRAFLDAAPALAWSSLPDGSLDFYNQRFRDYTGLSPDGLYGSQWKSAIHRDDIEPFDAWLLSQAQSGKAGTTELRLRRFDGEYRWFQIAATPVHDTQGNLIRWHGISTDIDDRKCAEQDLRTITDVIRQSIVVLTRDGTTIYANRIARDRTGLTLGDVNEEGFFARAFHPDDVDRVQEERRIGLLEGLPFELEMRLQIRSGQYRWQLIQYDPLKDERGQILRWYVTGTDIDDQKRKEERLRNENLILREEIDRTSMFEEIVGSSKPMRQVVKQVDMVAPSDSTVLILGETGTGKELVARALHRRSKRSNKAFVRINCAAIPQPLIASELFGHEKGAFTGALQRRLGRFEAADGGTIFLDEIGDLPMETQVALLRVLQEREFERVGSNQPIKVNVRLIAATNRNLQAAVNGGTFRQDLFYRLNVFPIAVPSLRERSEDIPLLVEYFVGRYAKAAGKNIRHIGKHTLEQLQAYPWPGNIRELQNVVERAVILTEGDTFVVDKSWLKLESSDTGQAGGSLLLDGLAALAEQEIEMIRAALAESHGRIAGPSGAATRLGIPRQTLESKIKRLGIDKYGQKPPTPK